MSTQDMESGNENMQKIKHKYYYKANMDTNSIFQFKIALTHNS